MTRHWITASHFFAFDNECNFDGETGVYYIFQIANEYICKNHLVSPILSFSQNFFQIHISITQTDNKQVSSNGRLSYLCMEYKSKVLKQLWIIYNDNIKCRHDNLN